MKHRHLNHQGYTLAAIDDIIARGKREDWADLGNAAEADPEIVKKIIHVCRANVGDPYNQRHRFWLRYAEEKLA
jgi:hypothetical protein